MSDQIAVAMADGRDREEKRSALNAAAGARHEADRRLTFLADLPDEAAHWQATAEQVQTRRAERRTLIVIVSTLLPALLFLYAGYFMSLRNAVVNAIEALVLDGLIETGRLQNALDRSNTHDARQAV